jgi:hypothetical protein
MEYRLQDYCIWSDDFCGGATIAATVGEGFWKITDTSAAGTPTFTKANAEHGGTFTLAFDVTNEVQNLCLDFGDKLQFDIDQLIEIEFRIKTVAALTAANRLAFGLQTNRNDNTDSTNAHAQFLLAGSSAVLCETDDNVNDIDDKATGQTLTTTFRRFVISFAAGKADVRFFIDGDRVAAGTTFNMSNFTTQLQPFVQLQKTASANTDSVTIDYVGVRCRRS